MTTSSLASSGASQARHRPQVVRIPIRCWCGQNLVTKTSKTEHNPFRRYFRCTFASSNKLVNDDHLFKWIDEGILEEIESINVQSEESQRLIIQDINITKSACEAKFAELKLASNNQLKISMITLLIGFIIMYIILKLVK